MLSADQCRGVISLILKEGKDLIFFNQLAASKYFEYRLQDLNKTLANRLQRVLSKLIKADLVGYVKNRYIGQNI